MYKFKKTTHHDLLATRNSPFTEEEKRDLADYVDPNATRAVGPVGRCTEPELVARYFADGGTITRGARKWAAGAPRVIPGWNTKSTVTCAATHIDNDGEVGSPAAAATSRAVHYGSDESE